MDACVYVFECVHVNCVCVCEHLRVYVCANICLCLSVYVHVCVYVFECECMCSVCVYNVGVCSCSLTLCCLSVQCWSGSLTAVDTVDAFAAFLCLSLFCCCTLRLVLQQNQSETWIFTHSYGPLYINECQYYMLIVQLHLPRAAETQHWTKASFSHTQTELLSDSADSWTYYGRHMHAISYQYPQISSLKPGVFSCSSLNHWLWQVESVLCS